MLNKLFYKEKGCQNWLLIELTNGNIGSVPAGSLLPIGAITRKVAQEPRCTPTFEVGTTQNNVVTVSEYTGTLVAGAAGVLTLSLLADGVAIATRSATVTADGSFIFALSKEIRVLKNCCNNVTPITLALQISGVAITGGNGTLILKRQAAV